jgi:hypothetical protein
MALFFSLSSYFQNILAFTHIAVKNTMLVSEKVVQTLRIRLKRRLTSKKKETTYLSIYI